MIAKPVAIPGIWGASRARPPDSRVNTSSGHSRLIRIALGRCSGSVVVALALDSSRAIGGLAWARRPSRRPMTAATSHQPTETGRSRLFEPALAARSTVTAASAVAVAALSRTVALRKSTNRTELQQRLEQPAHSGRAVDGQIGLTGELRRSFVGADGDTQSGGELARLCKRPQAPEGVQVGRVVTDVERRAHLLCAQQPGDPEALVEGHGGTHLEHLPPPVHDQALFLGLPGDLLDGPCGGLLVRGSPPVERGDRLLVLAAHTDALQLGGVDPFRELAHPSRPLGELGVDLGPGGAGAQQLAAVVADVGDRADGDDL